MERNELRNQLSKLEKEVVYYGESTKIMVGFAVTSTSDISYIREKSEIYQFSPILILDCTMTVSNMMTIIETADTDWEIMLYAPSITDETGIVFETVKKQLETNGRKVGSVVFSRIKSISEKEIALLQTVGFDGYTVYHDSPVSGQSTTGLVYFDFSRITSGEMSVEDRLSPCYSKKASMLYIFDMESIRLGDISEEKVTAFMGTLAEYSKKEGCSFATLSETVIELSKINQVKFEIETFRLEEIESIKNRMSELDDLISQIYRECFEELP